jgi:hypothetical protein
VKVLGVALLAVTLPVAAQRPEPAAKPEARPTVWTDHLRLVTYPADRSVAPGGEVSLVLDIAPRPRMHVYAPGATDYRVISVTVERQPFVRLLPVQYPASEIYVFEPLQERVPVYQSPFTLTQRAVLDKTPEALAAFGSSRRLTFTGKLDYQACDDSICFNPVSLPLSWTVELRSPEQTGQDRGARRPPGAAR